MKYTKLITTALLVALPLSAIAAKETPIPRSIPGDKGKYFLLEVTKDGNIVKTLHKRIGVEEVGFSRTEINCANMQYRDIGYGEGSPAHIKDFPPGRTKWTSLVDGSSKSDMVKFVCK